MHGSETVIYDNRTLSPLDHSFPRNLTMEPGHSCMWKLNGYTERENGGLGQLSKLRSHVAWCYTPLFFSVMTLLCALVK